MRRPRGAVRPSDRVSTPAPGTPAAHPPPTGPSAPGSGPASPPFPGDRALCCGTCAVSTFHLKIGGPGPA